MGCIRRAVCSFRGSPGLTAAPDGGCCTNPAAGLPLCGRRVLSASKDVKLVVATDLTPTFGAQRLCGTGSVQSGSGSRTNAEAPRQFQIVRYGWLDLANSPAVKRAARRDGVMFKTSVRPPISNTRRISGSLQTTFSFPSRGRSLRSTESSTPMPVESRNATSPKSTRTYRAPSSMAASSAAFKCGAVARSISPCGSMTRVLASIGPFCDPRVHTESFQTRRSQPYAHAAALPPDLPKSTVSPCSGSRKQRELPSPTSACAARSQTPRPPDRLGREGAPALGR